MSTRSHLRHLQDPARLDAVARLRLERGQQLATLDRYTRMAAAILDVPVAMVSVVTADEQLLPAQSGLAEPWASQRATPISNSFCQFVVTGEPLVVPDAAHHELVADNPARNDMGVAAYLGVPITDGDGNVLGALCAIDHELRTWSDRDVARLQDVADAVAAELALRVRDLALRQELRTQQVARDVEHALFEAAQDTTGTASLEGTARALVRHGAAILGTDAVVVALRDGDEVRYHTHGRVSDEALVGACHGGFDDPVVAALVEGRRIHVRGLGDVKRWADVETVTGASGIVELVAVPIGDDGDEPIGSIGVGWSAPNESDDHDDVIEALRLLAGQALRRAARFESELKHAQTLERIILPMLLPSPPGLDLAGAYLAPAGRQRVGGDMYDAIPRDDGSIGLVIADATGHDITAARAIARVRHAVGALTVDGRSPAQILGSVNRYLLLSTVPNLVTCTYVLLDPQAGRATIANAGHPQPILIEHDKVGPLGPTGDQLLGVASYEYREETVDIDPAAALLLYTDGLIERRGETLDIGLAALTDLCARLPDQSAGQLLEAVIAAVARRDREDDVAILCAQLAPMSPRARRSEVIERAWVAERVHLADAREAARSWLGAHGMGELAGAVDLVVTELLTNAREASAPEEPVLVRLASGDDHMVVEVENVGPAFDPDLTMPGAGSVRGRGLALVAAIADDVRIEQVGRVVRVSARFDR